MQPSSPLADSRAPNRLPLWAGLAFLGLGLVGHLYAAHAIGGSGVAYTHHVFGFGVILLVTGGLIAGPGWRFWRTRPGVLILVIGVVQALFGLWIAADPFRSVAGP